MAERRWNNASVACERPDPLNFVQAGHGSTPQSVTSWFCVPLELRRFLVFRPPIVRLLAAVA